MTRSTLYLIHTFREIISRLLQKYSCKTNETLFIKTLIPPLHDQSALLIDAEKRFPGVPGHGVKVNKQSSKINIPITRSALSFQHIQPCAVRNQS